MSHPLVELAKSWDVFEKSHPQGGAEEFCRFFLQSSPAPKKKGKADQSPPPQMGYTNKLGVHINRLGRYMDFFARKVMQELDVDNSEDFYYMATLHFGGQMRKSELIHQNISEFTSGTNVINRLLKKKLVAESPDPEDARSKLVRITTKGEKWMNDCLDDMVKVNQLTLAMLTEDEKKTACEILAKVDHFHSDHYPVLRQSSANEIKERYNIK